MDIRKLITGFLILAGATSSSALILSAAGNFSSNISPAAQPQIAAMSDPTANALGGNAFIPEDFSADEAGAASVILTTSSVDSNNLTNAVADGFLNGVVSANPSGPVDDGTGNPTLNNPDAQAIAALVANTSAAKTLSAPNWDAEVDAQPIKTTDDASLASITQYSNSLGDITNHHFVATNLESIVDSPNPDASQSGYVQSQVQGALGDTLALKAPAPLANFQKSMVKVLVYQKNILGLMQDANNDPVRASLVLQQEEGKYTSAVQDLQDQMQKAGQIKGFTFGAKPKNAPGGIVALVNGALGIKTAQAQWLTFDAANFGEWILKFVKNLLLQILKNILIALIQKKVLAWIQGHGTPRFIQQWGTTLVMTLANTAIGAINSKMQCVYPLYAGPMKNTLQNFYRPKNTGAFCADLFQASLRGNTLPQFYNNFARGGYMAYAATMMPSGNYYGGLFFNAQSIGYTAQNAQQAISAKSIANNGHNGDQVCDDGTDPNGEHWVCENPDGPDYNIDASEQGQCTADGGNPVLYGNGGKCPDSKGNFLGEPRVTTPGTFTGFAASTALDSGSKLATAANDIAGILNAVLSSLLNSLASFAVTASGQFVSGGGNNGGVIAVSSGTIQGGGTNNIPPVKLSCNPASQTASTTVNVSIGAVGGTNDPAGNPPLYTWTASNGTVVAGFIFGGSFALPGTYSVTLTDSAGDPPATCRVIVQ